MKVSWDHYSPNIWKDMESHKIHVPNHQPDQLVETFKYIFVGILFLTVKHVQISQSCGKPAINLPLGTAISNDAYAVDPENPTQ
jgi:hypothetical protein